VRWAGSRACDFESTRFATGRKNSNLLEIYGDKGAVAFSLERMNKLQCLDAAIQVFLLKSAGRGILYTYWDATVWAAPSRRSIASVRA
jgi:hypothetical protein